MTWGITAAILATGAYSANRSSAAAKKNRQEMARQEEMNRIADRERLAQEGQIAAQSLAAQRAAQAQAMRQFNEQQAAMRRAQEEAKQAEIRRQQNIQQGQGLITDMFGQFNDDFYNQRRQSYVDYAKPQLDSQYQDSMNDLVRSLARSGNLNSSTRGNAMSDLQRQYQEGLSTLSGQGSQYANSARSSIEAARSGLLQQNATLADPGTVRGIAQSQVASLSSAPTYSPIGSLISALTLNSGDTAGVNKKAAPQTGGVGLISNSLTTGSGRTVQ